MYAPMFHPAMKYVMPARKAIGFRTFFNILGPLTNPAGVRNYVIGYYIKDVAIKWPKYWRRLILNSPTRLVPKTAR